MAGGARGAIAYWVTCMLDPWPQLAHDDAFGDIIDALRDDGEYRYDEIEVSLVEGGPAFVPAGSVVLHVVGPSSANWDEVLDLLDAIAAAGEGVVYAEDRQIVLDRRSVRPGTKAFIETPAWATRLVAAHPTLDVVVFATDMRSGFREHLEKVGLAALASRLSYQSMTGFDDLAKHAGVDASSFMAAVRIVATNPVDALVAAQVLAHYVKGRAFALASNGAREQLPP